MSRTLHIVVAAAVIAACSQNPPPSSTTPACNGNRVLVVNNAGDEAVIVYAINGRTSVELGAVAQGKKELAIPSHVRATSFFARAISAPALSSSPISATTDSRVIFQEECRPK